MNIKNFPRRHLLLALALWLLAAMQFFWLASFFERLRADYFAETFYAAKSRTHQTPTAPAEEFDSVVRRRDQTLSSDETHSVVQGDMHWLTPAGVAMFEIQSLYGVDRQTRENLHGYGNETRTGQFLFPPHTERKTYGQWNPHYGGPHVAMYDHDEKLGNLPVYVFNFLVDGIDETLGFASLPDVPEKYRAVTYGKGRIWIEPQSGLVVDYEDSGVSYFVDPKTGERVAEIFKWSDRYTPETRSAQLRLATRERWRMFALERGLPGALMLAGLVWAACGLRRIKKPLPAQGAAQLLEFAR
jgi:hypothetical protein